MKQTAVEWLVEQLNNGKFLDEELIKKAKEMEKQQIINAHLNGQLKFDTDAYKYEVVTNAEQYYNKTF